MRTETSFRHTTKAAFAFVFTTATYLLARTTGFLPSWLNRETLADGDVLTALSGQNTAAVQRIDQPSFAVEVHQSVMPWDSFHPIANQRRLLQQGDAVVTQSIPDQVIDVGTRYQYALDKVFSGNYTLLSAIQTGQAMLPNWLTVEYKLLTRYSAGSAVALTLSSSGNTLFLANAPAGLQILDVSDVANPRLLSIFQTVGGYARNVVVSGTVLYLADNFAGMEIIDVSNTSNPRLLANYPAGSGQTLGLTLSGNLAYVANYNSLLILNVTVPTNPVLLSNYSIPGNLAIQDIAVSNKTVFLADGQTGMPIIDVTNPRSPKLLSTYSISNVQTLALSGNTAFISAIGYGLYVVNVSNTSNPRLLSVFQSPAAMNTMGISISGHLLFLSCQSAGLQILDASNSSGLRLVSSYSVGVGAAFAVTVRNSMIYMANIGELLILDVSRGNLAGVPPTGQLNQRLSITVNARDTLTILNNSTFTLTLDQLPHPVVSALTDQSLFPGQSLSLPVDPELLFINPGESFLQLSLDLLSGQRVPSWLNLQITPILLSTYPAGSGEARDIAVSGDTVFIADYSAGLQVLNVSSLAHPYLLSNYPANGYSGGGAAFEVAVANNAVFVAAGLAGSTILNMNNLSNPTVVSSMGNAWNIAISGNNAYLVDQSLGLKIYNVTTLSSPLLLTTYGLGTINPGRVAVSGNTVFVSAYDNLKILDVTNITAPRLLSTYPITNGGFVTCVAVDRDTVFLGDSVNGLQILDVSNPVVPRLLSRYGQGAAVLDVAVAGKTAFLAVQSTIHILNIKNTSNPQVLAIDSTVNSGSLSNNGAQSIAISGSTLFVGVGSDGLEIYDVSQWQLTATPGMSDVGNYILELTATDVLAGSASTQPFTIRVEGPPQMTGIISTQYARVGQFFNYFTPEGLFIDPNFDPISFTATLSDGTALPNWLAFNGISAAFAGTPSGVGNISVLLSATDNIAGTVSTIFNIITSHLPVADLPISTQVTRIGAPFYFKVPSNAFFDQDGNPLTYTAQRAGGQPLPVWLLFNATVPSFSGTPNETDAGQYSLQIVATDPYEGQASAIFALLVEHFPVANQTIPSQTVRVSELLNFVLSPSAFSDADLNPLSYRARRPDGSNLPNWLGFNPQTLIFSGQPAKGDLGVLTVQVVASDPYGASATQNFNISILDIPTLGTHIPRQLLNIGTLSQFGVPANAFNYQGSGLRYFAYQQLNQTLPAWLQFNNASLIFSSAPQSNDTGTYSLSVVAQDNYGNAATNTFDAVVERFPIVNQTIAPVTASVGNPLVFTIPSGAFMDPEGDPLTYSTRRADGSALPSWLTFESSDRVFSGIPVVTDIGPVVLQLIATDPQGGSAQQNITLNIVYAPVINILPPAPKPLREERAFNLSLSPQTFSDPGGAALNYSATRADGSVLPSWLNFFPQNLSFSGTPALTDVGTLSIQIIAINPQGSYVSLPLNLAIWNNFPPQVMQTLSNQQATVLNAFQFFAPPDTFTDVNEDVLHYTATQVDGQSLPSWLHFDAQRLGFYGTPKRRDTGDFAAQVIPVALTAHDDKSSTSTQFNISVQGTSSVALFLQVVIPLLSTLATAYGVYKKRALVLNRYKPERYQRLTEEKVTVGDTYEHKLQTPADQVKKVQVVLPHPREDYLRFFMSPYRSLPGGLNLPAWLDYDTDTNTLRSKRPIPNTASPHLIVQVRGKDNVILEQFPLDIDRGPVESKGLSEAPTQVVAPALPGIGDEDENEMQAVSSNMRMNL